VTHVARVATNGSQSGGTQGLRPFLFAFLSQGVLSLRDMVNGYDAPPVDDARFDDPDQRGAAIAAEREHLDRVEAELRALAGHIYAAQARYLELVAEFDRLKGWAERGYRSPAQWLSITTGAAPGRAREQLRVASSLQDFPAARDALARGELSYDKVACATKMMSPVTESDLVHLAIHAAPSDLQAMVTSYLAAERVRRIDAGELDEDPADTRYLRANLDGSGSWTIRARLDADEGEVVRAALEAAGDMLFKAAPEEHAGRDAEARRADALVAVAELALEADDLPAVSGGDRYQVMVTVDAATLGGHGDDVPQVGDSVAITRRALEQLSCDCSVVALIERDGEPLGVGRKTRKVPAAVRRALRKRDRHCRFPGCRGARFVDAHHLEHWVAGGPTDLDNLVTLCRYHHRLVHRAGYRVEATSEGGFAFIDRYRRRVSVGQATADPPGPGLDERNEALGLWISEETVMRWAGDYMDRHKAVYLFMLDEDEAREGRDPPDTG